MSGQRAALVALAVIMLTGCGEGSERAARGSPLPPAPTGVADGCREAAETASFAVLCPARWPATGRPARVRLRLYGGAGAYLLEAQSGFGSRSPVFHVLFGGQDERFTPRFEGSGKQLRLTTRRVTTPIHKGGEPTDRVFVVERPARRIGTTRVHGRNAAIIRAPPYPQGGIHGDHAVIMWNEGGNGYLVSAHSEASHRAAIRAAIQIARSTRPEPD